MVLEEPKNISGKKLVDLANCFQIIFSLSLSLQTLPIFLDKLVPPWAAILTSVTLILMFGEVVYHQSQMEIV